MNNNNNSSKVKSLLLYLGIPIVIILVMTLVLSQGQKDSHTYSEIVQYFHDDKVEAFDVESSGSSTKDSCFRTRLRSSTLTRSVRSLRRPSPTA